VAGVTFYRDRSKHASLSTFIKRRRSAARGYCYLRAVGRGEKAVMNSNKMLTQAYNRCSTARDFLRDLPSARLMETTEDKAGIVWERWIVSREPQYDESGKCIRNGSTRNLYLHATPHTWDISVTVSADDSVDATFRALRDYVENLQS
jgi:hypothetical protein